MNIIDEFCYKMNYNADACHLYRSTNCEHIEYDNTFPTSIKTSI